MNRIKMVLERTAPKLNYKNDMRAGRQNEDFLVVFERCHLSLRLGLETLILKLQIKQ